MDQVRCGNVSGTFSEFLCAAAIAELVARCCRGLGDDGNWAMSSVCTPSAWAISTMGNIDKRLPLERAARFGLVYRFDAVAGGAGQLPLRPTAGVAKQADAFSIGFVAEHVVGSQGSGVIR
jgi:hypothetical protein